MDIIFGTALIARAITVDIIPIAVAQLASSSPKESVSQMYMQQGGEDLQPPGELLPGPMKAVKTWPDHQ